MVATLSYYILVVATKASWTKQNTLSFSIDIYERVFLRKAPNIVFKIFYYVAHIDTIQKFYKFFKKIREKKLCFDSPVFTSRRLADFILSFCECAVAL